MYIDEKRILEKSTIYEKLLQVKFMTCPRNFGSESIF